MTGTPPTGPWRWVIFFVRTGVGLLCAGIFKSMGVFLDEFVEYFECTTRAAGLTLSLPFTLGCVTGIFTEVLLKKMGARPLLIFSGAVFAVSFIAAVISTSLVHIASFFIVCSFGYTVTHTVSTAVLLQYFPDNFATMNGISLVGGSLGMMILPPAVQQLIQLYGWQGALALLGAVSANFCVFAALVRPLRTTTRDTYKPIAGVVSSSATNQPRNESFQDNCRQKFRTLCDKLDLIMFVDEPGFVTNQIVNFLCGIIYCGWHIFLIPHGIALGFNETMSSFLATFAGLGSVLGRLSSGVLIDHGLLQAHTLFAGSAFLLAPVCLLDSIASPSYEAIATLATLGGFCFGIQFPLMYVLSVSFPEERRVSAIAWTGVFFGCGMSAGGFLLGWIYDVTGDYGVFFCTMGVLSAVMGAFSLTLMSTCFPCKTRE